MISSPKRRLIRQPSSNKALVADTIAFARLDSKDNCATQRDAARLSGTTALQAGTMRCMRPTQTQSTRFHSLPLLRVTKILFKQFISISVPADIRILEFQVEVLPNLWPVLRQFARMS